MAFFEFPHTRNYDGDLGYVIKKIIELSDHYDMFFKYNSIKFADPLQWDITKQYEAYTIVFDYDSGYSYISRQAVPTGIALSNPDFWTVVGPLIIDAWARTQILTILSFIANIYETGSVATAVRSAGEYVVANGMLYKTTATINIGEGYTVGINVVETTIENMILDQFPVGSSQIADGAVITSKIPDGAVTTPKIADHSINLSKKVEDKYLFIGDSYNKDYHHSWGDKVASRLGLSLNIDYWKVATSGGSFGNGLIYADLQTLTSSLSAAEKYSITKIVMICGINDWSQTQADIIIGVTNIESHLLANYPNAELIWLAAQWGYYNNIYRQGVINAYNIIAKTFTKTRVVDKVYVMMMTPSAIDSDMVHPTDTASEKIATAVVNALNGGSTWNYYSYALTALVETSAFGGNTDFTINGAITEAGTHIWRTEGTGIFFSPSINIGDTPVQIGTIQLANNDFFQREAVFSGQLKVNYVDGGGTTQFITTFGEFKVTKHSDSDDYWDVFFSNKLYINGSYTINVRAIYPQFDHLLDYTRT